MAKLPMKWDEMSKETKEHFLSKACMNSRLSAYGWNEFQAWEKKIIKDTINSCKGIEV
jgi:hypothetical protein